MQLPRRLEQCVAVSEKAWRANLAWEARISASERARHLHLLQVLAQVHRGGQRDGADAQQRVPAHAVAAVAARAAAAVLARQQVPVACAHARAAVSIL